MPKARISAAMRTPRDRAHGADRRGLQFLAAGVATVAGTRTSPGRKITSHRIGLKFPAQRLEVPSCRSGNWAQRRVRSGLHAPPFSRTSSATSRNSPTGRGSLFVM